MSFDFDCNKCDFISVGWDTVELRDKRAAQHLEEHDTGEAMQELGEFRLENGVEV